MTRTSVASLLAIAVAGIVAQKLGGRVGTGVLLGALAGTGMCGLGLLHQRHVLRHRPQQSMQAMMVSFLAKLVVLTLGALAFRFLEPVSVRADWQGFLVAYAGVIALVLPVGTIDLARGRSPRGPSSDSGLSSEASGSGASTQG